jgi:hypothetical protein
MTGRVTARQTAKAAQARAEKRARLFTTLGLVIGFGSWAYSAFAPAPSLKAVQVLVFFCALFLVIAVWEFFDSAILKSLLTAVIVCLALWSARWARQQYEATVARAEQEARIKKTAEESKRSEPIFQEKPNIRVAYLRFEGAILLRQVLSRFGFSTQDGFATKPFLVENEVYRNLSSILSSLEGVKTASRPFDVLSVYGDTGAEKESWFVEAHDGKVAQLGAGTDPAAGKRTIDQIYPQAYTQRGPSFVGPLNIDTLFSRVDSDPNWQLDVRSEADTIPFDGYAVVGLPDPSEALKFTRDPLSREVLHINQEHPDIVALTAHSIHGGYYGTVWVREIKLLCLDIENIGDKPIGLSSMKQQMVSVPRPFGISTIADQENRFAAAPLEERPLRPEALRPNEHLFIPLQLEFGIADKMKDHPTLNGEGLMEEDIFPKKWWEARNQEEIPFEVLVSSDDRGNPSTKVRSVSRSTLAHKPDFSSQIEKTYILGSSVKVQEVIFRTGDGTPTPWKIRSFDPNNLLARGVYEAGSCPILFSKRTDHAWNRLGPILIDAVTRAREMEFSMTVQPGSNSFRLSEQEDETTFLKDLRLVITDERQARYTFYPHEKIFASSRTEYRKLSPGESLRFTFQVPQSLKSRGSWKLLVTGYYVPHLLLRR